jgi:ribosomal-protein-alanine N-acetyltransferase
MSNVIPFPVPSVRRASREDLDAVAGLVHAAWHATYGPCVPAPLVARKTRSRVREALRPRVAKAHVALLGSRVVGYSDLRANCVDQLWVDPAFRRRGVGTCLLADAVAILERRGFLGAQIGCEDFNTEARRFLERRGWRLLGSEPHSLAPGRLVEALVYGLDLGARRPHSGSR